VAQLGGHISENNNKGVGKNPLKDMTAACGKNGVWEINRPGGGSKGKKIIAIGQEEAQSGAVTWQRKRGETGTKKI